MSNMDDLLKSLKENGPSVMEKLKKEKEKNKDNKNPINYEEANKIVDDFYKK